MTDQRATFDSLNGVILGNTWILRGIQHYVRAYLAAVCRTCEYVSIQCRVIISNSDMTIAIRVPIV